MYLAGICGLGKLGFLEMIYLDLPRENMEAREGVFSEGSILGEEEWSWLILFPNQLRNDLAQNNLSLTVALDLS